MKYVMFYMRPHKASKSELVGSIHKEFKINIVSMKYGHAMYHLHMQLVGSLSQVIYQSLAPML